MRSYIVSGVQESKQMSLRTEGGAKRMAKCCFLLEWRRPALSDKILSQRVVQDPASVLALFPWASAPSVHTPARSGIRVSQRSQILAAR